MIEKRSSWWSTSCGDETTGQSLDITANLLLRHTSMDAPETAPMSSTRCHCKATSDAIGTVELVVLRDAAPWLNSLLMRWAQTGTNFLRVYAGLALEQDKTKP